MENDTIKLDEDLAQDHKDCPVQDLLSRLGDKWSMLVIVTLAKADNNCMRFSELQRGVSGISQRMLSTTLKNFERDGIVSRQLYPEVPPRVEYTLTKRGKCFLVPVKALVDWMVGEWPNIELSRKSYDSKKPK
jgi:DNA-binding HxlR family transcriptional regulator